MLECFNSVMHSGREPGATNMRRRDFVANETAHVRYWPLADIAFCTASAHTSLAG
jgi:hypothetical protein